MIPENHIRQVIEEASAYFTDADKRERNADERSRAVADAHRKGWETVAKAIDNGFRAVADAIRDRR